MAAPPKTPTHHLRILCEHFRVPDAEAEGEAAAEASAGRVHGGSKCSFFWRRRRISEQQQTKGYNGIRQQVAGVGSSSSQQKQRQVEFTAEISATHFRTRVLSLNRSFWNSFKTPFYYVLFGKLFWICFASKFDSCVFVWVSFLCLFSASLLGSL